MNRWGDPRRLPIVGVMGSGNDPHEEKATVLGRWLAQRGVHLLTGGGGGVMTSVSKAFNETPDRRGRVIGVVPGEDGEPKSGYPNSWVEIPIITHLSRSGTLGRDVGSRNHINILSSDLVVALPGNSGTSSEVALALSYGRPIVAFVDGRDQIPDLSHEVPIRATLEAVSAFVEAQLEGLAAR